MDYQHAGQQTDQVRRGSAKGTIRPLLASEAGLLREHLLRLDPESRHDRFNGFVDNEFVANYAARSVASAVIVAYVEDGKVRGAAELHHPGATIDSEPEAAFSVEAPWRRTGLGTRLFGRLIEVARSLGYPRVRITTGSHNDAMRALAHKFGARLTFTHGESTGVIDLAAAAVRSGSTSDVVGAWANVGRAWLAAANSVARRVG